MDAIADEDEVMNYYRRIESLFRQLQVSDLLIVWIQTLIWYLRPMQISACGVLQTSN